MTIRTRIFPLLRAGLSHRFLPIVLAGIAVLVMFPSLRLGWVADDLWQRAWLLEPSQMNDGDRRLTEILSETGDIPPDQGRLSVVLMDLYYGLGPRRDVAKLLEVGILPWWVSRDAHAAFWRPLAALTHWIDFRLWPNSPELMHAQSILWFAIAVFVIALLYRRLVEPAWVAGLAALLYTIDVGHYVAVAWIANRSALISLLFGVGALLCHDRWRQGSVRWAPLAPACLLLALLAGEGGISAVAYLAAYAMFLDNSTWTQRALSLTPSLFLVGAWRFIYRSLGYFTYGLPGYIDPVMEPLRFIARVFENGPILLLAQGFGLPAVAYNFVSEPMQKAVWLASMVALAVVLIIFLPLLRHDRVARFWGAGLVLSVLLCGTTSPPTGRHLFFVGLGMTGLIAQFVGGLLSGFGWLPNRRIWRIPAWSLCIILLVLHAGVSSVRRFFLSSENMKSSFNQTALCRQLDAEPGLESQDLIIVNATWPFAISRLPYLRAQEGDPFPKTTRILAPGFTQVEVVRTGKAGLVVRTKADSLFSVERPPQRVLAHSSFVAKRYTDILLRRKWPSVPGAERMVLGNVAIEISRLGEDGLPKEVSFEFGVPLGDPSLRWLMWDWPTSSYVPFTVPAVGESVQIPGPFSRVQK